MKLEKIGMRTIKTGIAVTLCVLASKFIIQNPMFAGVGCVASVQDTVKGSFKLGFNRVKGTIIGGIIGFLCVLISPGNAILSGLGIMATIYGCTTFKLNSGIIVSSVTFLSIHQGIITTNPAYYSIHRVIDTSVGVMIGILVNYLLARPDYVHIAQRHLNHITKLSKTCLEAKIINKEKFHIERLEKEIKKLEMIYSKVMDELNYSKNTADIEDFEKAISISKELYFHMQSIELLEKQLYINKENYKSTCELLKIEKLNWKLNENKSPVFNYHLSKIIEEIQILKNLNNPN